MSGRRPKRLHQPDDPYPVLLEAGLCAHVGRHLRTMWPGRRVAVITQRRVGRLHGRALEAGLRRESVDHVVLLIPEGESHKTLDTARRLYDGLISAGLTRDDAVVAFGGGTVGDTAGFVAATYLRGIPYVQVPTTLLAQIDSSVGAKVGVNHPRAKNLIGAMYRPDAVFIDPEVLSTLPPRELRSGTFELLKYGFIGVPGLLRRMESALPDLTGPELERAIADGVRRKLAVVREDEGERGLRRILNFGHTIGHGLESASDFRTLRHGEAVGWGMIAAVRLAERRGAMSPELSARLETIVRRVGKLPSLGSLSAARVLDGVSRDKKRSRRGLRFILPTGFGTVEVVERFPEDDIVWALESLGVGRRRR